MPPVPPSLIGGTEARGTPTDRPVPETSRGTVGAVLVPEEAAQAFDPGGAFLELCTTCHAVRCKAGDVLCVSCRRQKVLEDEADAPPRFRRPGDWEISIAPPRRPRVARFPDGKVVVPFGPLDGWDVFDAVPA